MGVETILLVEDDKPTRYLLREYLENSDFLVIEAAARKRCLEVIGQHSVSLILMDLNLPDACGLDFIHEIKAQTNVPLIVVSSEQDENKRIQCFETGADDFVPKPFTPKLLVARVKAHIRRYGDGGHAVAGHPDGHECIRFYGWTLNRLKLDVLDEQGQSAALTCKEFQLLDYIVSHPDRVLRRDELREVLREQNYVPTARAIDVKMTRIRQKIEDNAAVPRIIKTVRGVGYIFMSDDEAHNENNHT